jgi:hypothetical protein
MQLEQPDRMVIIKAQYPGDAIEVIRELIDAYIQSSGKSGEALDEPRVKELKELWDKISEAVEE